MRQNRADTLLAATGPGVGRPIGDTIAVAILGLSAIAAPIALGASGALTRLALESLMTAAVICWACGDRRPIYLTIAPLLICGLVLLQLVPIPDRLLVNLAPVSAGAWKVAHAGMTDSWGRISVDPAATLTAARRLLIGLATVVAVISLGRSQSQRKQLITAIAISGTIILSLGLVFGPATKNHVLLGFVDLSGPLSANASPSIMPVESAGAGGHEWVTVGRDRYQSDSASVGDGFGTYIYSNHFAGAVTLTLPIALAAWLFVTTGRLADGVRYLPVAFTVAIAAWSVGIRAQSRAGVGSLLFACIALIATVVVQQWPRRVAATVTAAATALFVALSLALLGAFQGIVQNAPPELQAAVDHVLNDARVISAQVALRMFLASPLLGTGLDTYQDIFPRFYQDRFTLFYAHNDYAQILAETGFVGAAILLTMIAALVVRYTRFYREAKGPYRTLNAGPWAALAGIATHSAFDWNLHLPANALLACLVVGLTASSVPNRRNPNARNVRARVPEIIPRAALVIACFCSLTFLARDAVSEMTQRQLRDAIVADRLTSKDPKQPSAEDQLLSAINAGQAIARWDRGNSRLALLIGQANLHIANQTNDRTASEALRGAADQWFQRAKRCCAACRGLPEPVPREHKPETS